MNKSVIGITGITGFVGGHLGRNLSKNGFEVIGLGREARDWSGTYRYFDLEKPVDQTLLQGVNVLIHCAFVDASAAKNSGFVNFTGTEKLVANAHLNQVNQLIFFSTVSAHADALSQYGKSKFETEKLFQKHVIIKSGLVIGDGGLFRKLLDHALSRRVVPLIDGGIQPMQVLSIDDLLQSVEKIIRDDLRGQFVLANNEQLTYWDFFEVIARVHKTSFRYIRVPGRLLEAALAVAQALRIKLPVSRENLRGLRALKFWPPSPMVQPDSPMTLEQKLLEMNTTTDTASV